MAISSYHQQYIDQSDEQILKKANAKREELDAIFAIIQPNTTQKNLKIAVFGCGDKRLVDHHRNIFSEALHSEVKIDTFDLTTEHLLGEENVYKHDCSLPLANSDYGITYAHVLLKFIPREKQFDVIMNSFDSLQKGGIAIHCIDFPEIRSTSPQLPDGLWAVPLDTWKSLLSQKNIAFFEIPLQYGLALVLQK